MKYLFLFLKKQFFFLLFLFLELVAFLLLANNNNYHKSSIINSTNAITGRVNEGFSSISDYFMLKEQNRRLSQENAILRSRGELVAGPGDSLGFMDSSYRFIPARVISNTNRSRNNFIMINKGKKDGVDREMGIISPAGIAGIVVEVTQNYATAISMLHKDSRISARLKKSGQMVNVIWDGSDYRKGIVEDIPTHIVPMAGDTVVTSGYSFVFPQNIMIGTIGEMMISGGTLNKAELLFSTDFNRLGYVYVCKNMASSELDSLINSITDE
ncbi:MAG TPA: rod shape-determining protein MreC [Bacteroidales bacterium]|nr:rod shape-determining protein MreC [Bacteroidales bacterium]